LLFQILAGSATMLSSADMVVLKNSDRLTGEIQQLKDNRLSLKTSYAGVLSIDWNMVDRVSSNRSFRVEAGSGRQLTGTIRESPQALEIQTEGQTVSVALAGVVAMEPVSEDRPAGFWQRLEGNLDLGYSLTRGNSQLNQSSLGFQTKYGTTGYQVQAEINSLFSRQSDAPTTSTHTATLRYDRFLSSQAFAFALNSFERDDRQLLNLRASLGGGLGWQLIKSNRTELSLLTGSTFVNEQFRQGPAGSSEDGSSGEALLGLSLDKAALGRITFTSKLSAFRNFVGVGRYRIALDGGMRVPLVSRFSWSLRLFDRFDSRPPRQVKRNDYGLVSSFGVVF
jgi:putative salt-induced outer membrane protein YdiY